MDFWILVEKILSIDEMDLEVRDHYLSLLFCAEGYPSAGKLTGGDSLQHEHQ